MLIISVLFIYVFEGWGIPKSWSRKLPVVQLTLAASATPHVYRRPTQVAPDPAKPTTVPGRPTSVSVEVYDAQSLKVVFSPPADDGGDTGKHPQTLSHNPQAKVYAQQSRKRVEELPR